ncbi:MAG: CapA family protein, partial [Actinomycetes bacterium]
MSSATPVVVQVAVTPRTFTVVSSGDLLLHERLWNQAMRDGKKGKWDFYPQLADIAPITKTADLALCHLETPLATLGGHYTGYPVFNSPPQIVAAVKRLGFDMCDQTSNHTFDAGAAGIKRTLDDLDLAGIAHTGSYRTAAESKVPLVISVGTPQGPVKVGIVAFTYGFNGFPYPGGKKWLANEISVPKIEEAARQARAAGAEVVIAKLHWGSEYTNYPNSYQTGIAKALAASGLIDLIDGDHTHSVQPIQKIGKMWVI